MSFGHFVTIERQLTDQDFYCRYGLTNEIFPVHVLAEFADEIGVRYLEPGGRDKGMEQEGCIFKCRDPQGRGYTCAIYPTRPKICRDFRCYRMLIYHKESGELRGKVIGAAELMTRDETLIGIWGKEIKTLSLPSDSWIKNVIVILAANGYYGDPVE